MRKRNKLYTANKWNQPLFMQGNSFDSGGNLMQWDKAASDSYGANYGEAGYTLDDYMKSKNIFGISKELNPFSKGNLSTAFSKANIGSTIKNNAGAIGTAAGVLGNKILSGGYSSGAGNAVSGIGSAVGGVVSTVNPILGGAVSAATGLIGGGINALFGTKVNKQRLNAANAGTNYLNNFKSEASTFDGIQGPEAVSSVQNAYKGGLFSKGKARRKNAELRTQRVNAESWANRSVDNNIDNIKETQMDNIMGSYYALGGSLDDNQGAIDYGFMSDYLTMRNKAAGARSKQPDNIFGSLAATPMGVFALGGDIQSNGADWSNGLSEINAGGTHEENPYQGVQVGINRENGEPNLVEEGETIFDDYVYSKRIRLDKQAKKKFHVGKNADISYADLSKKLQKESLERPNDAISQQGLTRQMHDLAEEQERQKSEEIQDAFAQLPPEQQRMIMQQIAMQEQQAMQQEEQAQQEGMPQEEQTPEQQQEMQMQENMEQQPSEQQENAESQMNACGGKLNRYDKGGELKKKIYNLLGVHTDRDFEEWTDSRRMPKIKDWENILENKYFLEAIGKENPSLRDAIARGYDFGMYTPKKDKLTFDFAHGGWGKEDYDAWDGSTDAAWKEAVEKGLVKKGMNSEEIGKALMQTDAYKRGSDWLRNSEDNRLKYLQAIYNSEDAPQSAKDYAGKYVDKDGWIKNAKRDYKTIFEDPNSEGVRNTHPGTYWKTPDEVLRDSMTKNMVINNDGSVEEIIGNVPKDWVAAGNYGWADEGGDYLYNYYKRNGNGENTESRGNNEEKTVPVHKATWGRAAGLLGPVAGLGMQALGIGKPDYSRMDAALETMNEAPVLTSYTPIGTYLTYNPMDIWYEQSRMNANSRATDRAIQNNASPVGTKMAGLLANGYNSQTASGDLYRKALEYNDAQRQRVAEFNRSTDMYNAEAAAKTAAANAEIQNRNRQMKAQVAMEAANQRMAADAAWNQGIYGNINNLFKGLGEWGKENAQHNMIADMAADGLFGVIGDSQNIGKGYVSKKSCGGKLKRKKKGLTF